MASMYTANVYRQMTDKLFFNSVISTQRYQLSGQFLIFLVYQKYGEKFVVPKKKFGQPKKQVGWQKKCLLYQKIIGIPKNNLVGQKNEKLTGQLVYQWNWPIVQRRGN